MSHTPGPWEMAVDISPLFKGTIAFLEASPERYIAVVSYAADSVREHTANAHLIAAAPDLYALALAYEAWEADVIEHGYWDGIGDGVFAVTQAQYDEMLRLQDKRNAALAKARGEA